MEEQLELIFDRLKEEELGYECENGYVKFLKN